MSQYRLPGFDKVISEYFDIEHTETRKVLLNINEADQNQVLQNLTSKLYDNIVTKVDDIDFGTIPDTKGDITQLDSYDKLCDCVKTMHAILVQYKQDLAPILIIEDAITNVLSRKELFEKGFKFDVEFIMVTYSTITLSIVSSISFLIASCIDFIKTPNQDSFDLSVDRVGSARTNQNLLFQDLDKFNKACTKNQIDDGLGFILKNNIKSFTGKDVGFIVGGLAVIGILLNIIPIIRELIFFFYYSRTRVSDYFDIQADLLQMNAYSIQNGNNTLTKEDKQKIVNKQFKLVEMFRKVANSISISNKECDVKASKDLIADKNTKYKTSDVVDSVPDSASSSIF